MSRVPLRVSTMVSTEWLAGKISGNVSNLRILDGSWHMPFAKRNARQEFYQRHIPSAQFFDVDECCDTSSPYEHMLPTPEKFETYVGKLGINNNTHVVIYDNNENFGLFSAQRVWWTFRVFGHRLVSILDGGFPKWDKENRANTDVVDFVTEEIYKANYDANLVKSYEDIEKNLTEKSFTVLDARSAGRFEGSAPEPRPGVKPGHMPDAVNLPFNNMLDPQTKTLKKPEDLQDVFEQAGIDLAAPLASSCGSGMSACMLALAAFLCGKQDMAVYDGSWMEWYKRAPPQHKLNVPL